MAEANHDDKGLVWPRSVAPADIHVVATGKGPEFMAEAEKIVQELEEQGLSVLFDDRPKVSPGVRFGDFELLGVPTMLVVGRGLADGVLELTDRATGNTENISRDGVGRFVAEAIGATT